MFHDRPDTMTPFSSMLGTMTRSEDDFAITLPPDWLQGRTAYGGLSAALCVQAALRAHPDLPPLRSATMRRFVSTQSW